MLRGMMTWEVKPPSGEPRKETWQPSDICRSISHFNNPTATIV